MRRVVWSHQAAANLNQVVAYIEEFSPQAATRMGQRLYAAADALAEQPDRGRMVAGKVRELTLISPYIIRYRVDAEAVVILRIRHGARRPD